MTEDELKRRVDEVIAEADHDDWETAHSMEDALHLDVISAFCPQWAQAEIRRLSNATFDQWCA